MTLEERLAAVEQRIKSKRAAVANFSARYKTSAFIVKKYHREVLPEMRAMIAEREALKLRIQVRELRHDVRNMQMADRINIGLLESFQADSDILNEGRQMCNERGYSRSAKNPVIACFQVIAEKDARIRELMSEMAIAQTTLEDERATRPTMDRIIAAAETIGIETATDQAIAKWMIETFAALNTVQNTAAELKVQLSMRQQAPKRMSDMYNKPKQPDTVTPEQLFAALDPDIHDPLTLAYVRHWCENVAKTTDIEEAGSMAYSVLLEICKPWPQRGSAWQAVVLAGRGTKFGPTPIEAARGNTDDKVRRVEFGKAVLPPTG
jgi:hypothetical protein